MFTKAKKIERVITVNGKPYLLRLKEEGIWPDWVLYELRPKWWNRNHKREIYRSIACVEYELFRQDTGIVPGQDMPAYLLKFSDWYVKHALARLAETKEREALWNQMYDSFSK